MSSDACNDSRTFITKCHSVDSITELVDTTDITIIPTMNPDGFDRGKEGECSGTDYKSGRLNEGRGDEFQAAYYHCSNIHV